MNFISPDFKRAPLSFGPRLGEIFQLGYIVENLEESIEQFHRLLGVGPWLLVDKFECKEQTYKGAPTDMDVRIAVAWNGAMQIELIEQRNDVPSTYLDHVQKKGYGFHHYAVVVDDLAKYSRKFEEAGIEIPFRAITNESVGNMAVFYADTRDSIGNMIEVCEYTPQMDQMFGAVAAMAQNWDGQNLIHRA